MKTLKNNIYKYMTSISKNVYTDILHELVNKHKNTYYSTIKTNTNYLHIGVK